jgi:chromate transport protein ChrA
MGAMLPWRTDPVAGALVGTIVLAAFLAPPVLILALIVWLVVRAERKPSETPEGRVNAEVPPRSRD